MRKTLYILSFLIAQVTFSQVESSYLESNLFKENTKEIKHYINSPSVHLFSEINTLELTDIKNNSEGKFTLNLSNKKYFTRNETIPKNSILKKGENIKDVNLKKNLVSTIKKDFINKVIQKKIAEEIQQYILNNEALTYGDRSIESYKNYTELKNKLIIKTPISSDIELQIGKDIYPYFDKILKTELDKTLQNSLNLFAINF